MNNKNLRSMAAVALVFMLGGCATMEYVPINRSRPETVQTQLAVGDTVHIRLQNGDEWQFKVTALEPDTIVGRDVRIAYRDIDLLEIRTVEVEGPVKVGLALGALALVYVAAAVIEAESEADEANYCRSNGAGGCIMAPK